MITDPPRVAAAITDFLRRVPRDARFYGVRMSRGEPNQEQVLEAASYVALIETTLADATGAD